MDTTAARYLENIVQDFFNGLMTLRELEEGASDDELETIYALGYYLFTYGQYTAARDVFSGLTASAPKKSHYWRALGATQQQLKNYPEAIAAYNMAVAKEKMDIVSYVYRGETRILSDNIPAGIKDLERAISLGEQDSQFEAWVKRARLLLGIHKNA